MPLKELIKPIKEEEASEQSVTETEGSSVRDSVDSAEESMSILDCSLNVDPEYTTNNLFIDHKAIQFRWV